MEPVSSPRNPRVVAASRLRRARERRATGLTLLEGPNLVAEALATGAPVVEVFALDGDEASVGRARDAGVDVVVVEPRALERLAGTDTPRGPVAVMRIPEPGLGRSRDRLLLQVADPGNAGTLIRSAAAFGMDVSAESGAVDLWAPKVLRAAAGGHFRTGIAQPAPDDAGAGLIATVVHGGIPPAALAEVLDPGRRWTVVVGSEAHGVGTEVTDRADVRVTIPMPGGTESLNASVAGSIVAYEVSRWRHGGPSTT